jgi:hypothetical protein
VLAVGEVPREVPQVQPDEAQPGLTLGGRCRGLGGDLAGQLGKRPVELLDQREPKPLVLPAPTVRPRDLVAHPALQRFRAIGGVGHGECVTQVALAQQPRVRVSAEQLGVDQLLRQADHAVQPPIDRPVEPQRDLGCELDRGLD